tara:strand:+ start:436 stop:1980 length:1545 start_codon:yes stop_codon:yes gene_type:complete
MTQKVSGPVVLCVLDGWGNGPKDKHNAISNAFTPAWDKLLVSYPNGELLTSGRAVGLPEGQMGNSEVGHMSMGAGRIILQDLPRIDKAIEENKLFNDPYLLDKIDRIKKSSGKFHLLGLLSPGGVHSHQDHILELCKIFEANDIFVCVHAILDGRDTPPYSAARYIEKFRSETNGLKGVSISTLSGRYWAMDRDNRWDRVREAWKVLVHGKGEKGVQIAPEEYISRMYDTGVSDEFIKPVALDCYSGMKDGDGLIVANFRADRVREITEALVDPNFNKFSRDYIPKFTSTLGMCSYSSMLDIHMGSIFKPNIVKNVLGQIVSKSGLKQLRIAETEKYAHVTFFFNGGEEAAFLGEERILIPSPKVATYDLKPEMSAFEVAERLNYEIRGGNYDFILVNFANTDMVGHTGDLAAAIKAVEAVDKCIEIIKNSIKETNGALLITADHGNAEQMLSSNGEPQTSHTQNPVPFVLVTEKKLKLPVVENGSLCDIAPTVLDLLGLDPPKEMTGETLITT